MDAESYLDNQIMQQTPLSAMWRFRWLVLLATLAGGALALLLTTGLQPTQYQATASLVVTDPRATTLFSAADAALLNADRYVADQVAILLSDSVAQRASDLLATSSPPVILDAVEITDNVRVTTTDSNEILVRYSSNEASIAVMTVNAIIEAYELLRSESAARYSASAIGQLEQSIDDISNELEVIEVQIVAIRNDPIRQDLNDQYDEALRRLGELQPLLATTTGEELDELRAEVADIDRQLTRLAGILSIENTRPRLVQLDREQSEAIGRRSTLAAQRDRLLVDTQLLSGGISLSSPAQTATESNTAIPITVLGALVGLLIGGGLAYVLAQRRRKFAERAQPGWVLRTPLLAEIPVFGDEGIKSELPVLEYPASASAEAFRFAATALDLQTQRVEASSSASTRAPHIYLITSPGPQEGKTVLAANLALAAARKGRSVLAIDADFGHQRLSELLRGEHEKGPGITDIVESGVDLVSGTFSLGPPGPLDLMSRGTQPTNAPDFFSQPATQAFMAKVGRLYDIVLIDGPPMLHVAYASILAQYVDRVVVVTRHGGSVTRLEDLAQRLGLIGASLAGYVYNGAPLRYEMTLTEGSLKDVLGEGR